MLQDLMTGLEETSLVLVTDLASCPGRRLLLNWIYYLATRCDKVILVCFERHLPFFKNWLPLDMQKKIIDGRVTPTRLGRPADYVMDDVRNIVSHTEGTVGVVIDSLTVLLISKSLPATCSFLDSLAAESQVTQVVTVLHRDLHKQHIRGPLEYIAPTVIEMTSIEEKYTCSVRHCRPTGKVFKSDEYFQVDDKFHINNFGSVSPQDNLPQHIPQNDLTTKLPFNLSLTDAEKDARSNVKLPYLKDGSGDSESSSSGRIFYQPDEVDDFDDEDPDDDLNI